MRDSHLLDWLLVHSGGGGGTECVNEVGTLSVMRLENKWA